MKLKNSIPQPKRVVQQFGQAKLVKLQIGQYELIGGADSNRTAAFECLGAISQIAELRWPGIVGNAIMLTFGVLGLLLALYSFRIIRVTDGMVKGIIAATAAVCLVYVVDMVLNMFGVRMPYIHESGKVGIILSLVVVGIASANLLVDFRIIEDRIQSKSPRYMEWYCGMALLVTLVWLYLELLRLLSKMRSR
jgi:uncharacterized YccA/Bax inhibitor family protein